MSETVHPTMSSTQTAPHFETLLSEPYLLDPPYFASDERVRITDAPTRTTESETLLQPTRDVPRQAQTRADIDISGPEFSFVRSIRVYDVRHVRQNKSADNGRCNRSATVYLGTYGTQGDFSWSRSDPARLPQAHIGLETWGYNCPNISHRSVFVDWRDYQGNYGYEQVNH